MSKIAIIPARSGSKGLLNKNILNLYGKPLICWTIEAAIKSNQFDKVILSTDSKQYGQIGKNCGAEVIYRDESISNDRSSTYDVLKDLFNKIDTNQLDYFVLLQPTSPLRNEKHINEAITLFENNIESYNTLVSVTEAHKSAALIRPINQSLSLEYFDIDFSYYKRQDYKEYEPNGAIFISKIDTYLEVKHFFGKQGIAYIMKPEDSIDIDGRNDFELAISVLRRKNKKSENEILVKERLKELNISSKIENPITLIGHSFFDKWEIENINGLGVNNLGVNGATASSYMNNVLNKISFHSLGKYIFIMFGTNEIIYENNPLKISKEINECIKKVREYNPSKVFFINISNVFGYIDRSNELIDECKNVFMENIQADEIISTDFLNDEFGWLNYKYTYDGLHLNEDGYKMLEKKMIEVLKYDV